MTYRHRNPPPFRGQNKSLHNHCRPNPYQKPDPDDKREDTTKNPRRLTAKELEDTIEHNRKGITAARAEIE